MSKIGRKPINIPDGVEIKIDGDVLKVKGPKGELEIKITPGIKVEQKDNILEISRAKEDIETRLWGLERALLNNLIVGVSEGFDKKLEINGVGYRASVSGKKINLELGFSHPIEMEIPEGLEVKVQKNLVTVSGIDRQKVGQFAANIRSHRPPEPYKGKGIKYIDEQIIRKEGKKAAATEGAE